MQSNNEVNKITENDLIDNALIAAEGVHAGIEKIIADSRSLGPHVVVDDDEEETYLDDLYDSPTPQQRAEKRYANATQELAFNSQMYPNIYKNIVKRMETLEKKYSIEKINLPQLKQDAQNNIDALIQEAINKKLLTINPAISDSDKNRISILSKIIAAGENALKKGNNLSNSADMQNIFLQLRAFKKVRDTIDIKVGNKIATIIAIDNAAKEIRNTALYKTSNANNKPSRPVRWLHYLSLVLVVTLIPALYSKEKYGTMFYATNLEKKQIADKALKSFQNKKRKMPQEPNNSTDEGIKHKI